MTDEVADPNDKKVEPTEALEVPRTDEMIAPTVPEPVDTDLHKEHDGTADADDKTRKAETSGDSEVGAVGEAQHESAMETVENNDQLRLPQPSTSETEAEGANVVAAADKVTEPPSEGLGQEECPAEHPEPPLLPPEKSEAADSGEAGAPENAVPMDVESAPGLEGMAETATDPVPNDADVATAAALDKKTEKEKKQTQKEKKQTEKEKKDKNLANQAGLGSFFTPLLKKSETTTGAEEGDQARRKQIFLLMGWVSVCLVAHLVVSFLFSDAATTLQMYRLIDRK